VPETAEALGIGEATVKTHLHRVFGKTGAAWQARMATRKRAFSPEFTRMAVVPQRSVFYPWQFVARWATGRPVPG
jgi:hypothetical protein